MHEYFADWYRPMTFNHDDSKIGLRWQGVETALRDMDLEQFLELIRLAFNRQLLSAEIESEFRKYFKAADPAFPSAGNELELRVLAGCVLAVLCLESGNDLGAIPLAILTTSAFNTRSLDIEIELLSMAMERIKSDGNEARKRPDFSFFEETEELANGEEAEEEDEDANTEAALEEMKSKINCIQKTLTIQDEELQMLWWMVGKFSSMWERTFGEIDSKAAPILLAREAAEMTAELSEAPSLKAVFSRIGVGGIAEIAIPEAVNACGAENLIKLVFSSTPCSTIFPLHFALSRALETKADDTWIPGWCHVSGIDATLTIAPLEIAMQTHRELKLMALIEAQNE